MHPWDEKAPPADFLAGRAAEPGEGGSDQHDQEQSGTAAQGRRQPRLGEDLNELASAECVESEPDEQVREQTQGDRETVRNQELASSSPSPPKPAKASVPQDLGDESGQPRAPHERQDVAAPLFRSV